MSHLFEYKIAKGDVVVCYWKGSRIYCERKRSGKKEIIGHFNDPARANEFAQRYADVEIAQLKPHGVRF